MNSSNVSRIERKQVFAKFNDIQESNKDKKTSDYSRVKSNILYPRSKRYQRIHLLYDLTDIEYDMLCSVHVRYWFLSDVMYDLFVSKYLMIHQD